MQTLIRLLINNITILRNGQLRNLDLTHIDHPELMTKLFRLTAFYARKLSNLSEMGSKLGLSHVTIKKYMALLEQLFLVERLPAWHSNEYKCLIKTPKIHPTDTGIICAVRELNSKRLPVLVANLQVVAGII